MLKTFILPTLIAALMALTHTAFGADVAPTSDAPKPFVSTSTNPNPDPDAKNASRPQEQGVEAQPQQKVPVKSPAVTSGNSYQNGAHDEPVHHDQNVQHVEPAQHDPAGNPVRTGNGTNNPFVDPNANAK